MWRTSGIDCRGTAGGASGVDDGWEGVGLKGGGESVGRVQTHVTVGTGKAAEAGSLSPSEIGNDIMTKTSVNHESNNPVPLLLHPTGDGVSWGLGEAPWKGVAVGASGEGRGGGGRSERVLAILPTPYRLSSSCSTVIPIDRCYWPVGL